MNRLPINPRPPTRNTFTPIFWYYLYKYLYVYDKLSSFVFIVTRYVKALKDNRSLIMVFAMGELKNKYKNSVLGFFWSIYKSAENDPRIEFCGIFDYKELPNIMKNISVIVIPSVYKEIFPLVMQLGLAYKKPIIASNTGGIPETIKDGVNGYLFEKGNVNQLSEIISKITEDSSLLKKLQDNITLPPYVEEEAFYYSRVYERLTTLV